MLESSRLVGWRATSFALAMLAASPALAESAIELAYPSTLGDVPAATYDPSGAPVGEAEVFLERLPDGRLRMISHTQRSQGGSTLASAVFDVVEPGRSIRLVQQTAQSHDPSGAPLALLRVDHAARKASCSAPDGGRRDVLLLPKNDRVVNVPMNLFFLPLVRGEAAKLHFQLFLCNPEARLIEFEAWVENGTPSPGAGLPIEVRYGPDYGLASFVARQLAPRLSFWFDRNAPHDWAGHRMPLYSGGPEVLIVRDGIPSKALAGD